MVKSDDFTISLSDSPCPKDKRFLHERINAFNDALSIHHRNSRGDEVHELGAFIHDPDGKLVGGLVALALFALHALWEGTRWQMLPAYFLLLVLSLVILRAAGRDQGERRRGLVRKIASGFVCFMLLPLVLAVACFVPWAVPVFELPQPSGPHGIGVSDFKIDYPDRPETFTADEGDHRELMVRLWYPADVAPGSKPAPYLVEEEIGPL